MKNIFSRVTDCVLLCKSCTEGTRRRRAANVNTERADIIDRAIYKAYERAGGDLIPVTTEGVSLKRSVR